jgi:hypothetical protein
MVVCIAVVLPAGSRTQALAARFARPLLAPGLARPRHRPRWRPSCWRCRRRHGCIAVSRRACRGRAFRVLGCVRETLRSTTARPNVGSGARSYSRTEEKIEEKRLSVNLLRHLHVSSSLSASLLAHAPLDPGHSSRGIPNEGRPMRLD